MVDWARGCWVLSSFGRASCAGIPPERGDERSEPGLGLAARSAGVALQAWNPLAFSSPLGGRWYALLMMGSRRGGFAPAMCLTTPFARSHPAAGAVRPLP